MSTDDLRFEAQAAAMGIDTVRRFLSPEMRAELDRQAAIEAAAARDARGSS